MLAFIALRLAVKLVWIGAVRSNDGHSVILTRVHERFADAVSVSR